MTPGRAASPLPPRAGIGLRSPHHDEFLRRLPSVPFVEVHSENFFADGGPALATLDAVRADYPVSLHGIGASLGSADGLRAEHLRRLRRLVDRVGPARISEHLCWSGIDGIFLNDLLPLPWTDEALAVMADRVAELQDALGRAILVENISSYLAFAQSDWTEWDFLAELARRSGCGILLDVNNVYVSSVNHGFDPASYLAAMPAAAVGEIHLAGYTALEREGATLLIDTHSAPVSAPVWALYRQALDRFGPVPTLVEWDAALPSLDELLAEAARADALLAAETRAHVA